MKTFNNLFAILITAISPQVSSATWWTRLLCPVVGSAIENALDSEGCDCTKRWGLFRGHGVEVTCSGTTLGSFSGSAEMEVFARRITSELCGKVELDDMTEAEFCLNVDYRRSGRGLLSYVNWNSQGCEFLVSGEACNSCTITQNGIPFPEFELDCENIDGFTTPE